MIQQSLEAQQRVQSLIRSAEGNLNDNQLFELYLQLNYFINECLRQQIAGNVFHILGQITNPRLFRAVFFNLPDKDLGRDKNEAQKAIFMFIKERFHQPFTMQSDIVEKNVVIADFLVQFKGNLLQNMIQQCKDSQILSRNLLFSVNKMLAVKIKSGCATNLNLTLTCLLAFKVVQFWQKSSLSLVEQALRHILLVDHIQKGQVLAIICQNANFLSALRVFAENQANLNGYWLLLVSRIIELLPQQTPGNQFLIEQLQQKALQIVLRTVQKDKDLSSQIYNIQHSSLSSSQKLRMIQTARGYCIFASAYTKKQIQLGVLEQSLIQLIQQLMAIKDFLSFEYLVVLYAQICQLNHHRMQKLPAYMIERIQRNCLPLHKGAYFLINKPQNSNLLAFLDSKTQYLYRYSSSLASSEAMQYLIDKILEERGCKPKPRICPCFDSYMHSTIEMQYDLEFNQHDFISVANLMCREAVRVISMRPEEEHLEKLKSYMLQNIKWLLNLNQSCLAEYKRCINFKIFDLIVTFPYILNNNQFLQHVTEDLLVDCIPQTFYQINKLIEFYTSSDQQPNLAGLDRVGEKLLAKASQQSLTFMDKIGIWNFAMVLWQNNQEKLKEVLELYSLHEDHWVAKDCASKYRKKSKIMDPYRHKIADILAKWQQHSSYFYEELNILSLLLKER